MTRCTPQETLERALEDCHNAIECIVIMTAEDGAIITLGSTSILSTRLGLIEMAKTHIMLDVIESRTTDEEDQE